MPRTSQKRRSRRQLTRFPCRLPHGVAVTSDPDHTTTTTRTTTRTTRSTHSSTTDRPRHTPPDRPRPTDHCSPGRPTLPCCKRSRQRARRTGAATSSAPTTGWSTRACSTSSCPASRWRRRKRRRLVRRRCRPSPTPTPPRAGSWRRARCRTPGRRLRRTLVRRGLLPSTPDDRHQQRWQRHCRTKRRQLHRAQRPLGIRLG